MPTPYPTPIVDGQKACSRCHVLKPIDAFAEKHKGRERTRSHWCRECVSTYNREYWEKRGGTEARRAKNIEWNYGITTEQYAEMSAQQGGVCAICLNPPTGRDRWNRLGVDHCHQSGAVRGLLCGKCNKGLGHFADSADLLAAAIAYIRRFAPKEN